jgi:molybdenum cofactor synthesis domain-containing protein
MNAVVVAVGSELLGPGRSDTNGLWLIARLFDLGIETSFRAAVDDNVKRTARLIQTAREAAPVVILTGGLGPTEDDRTRDALALALDVPMKRDPAMVSRIEALFAAHGRIAGPRQARQAERPEGAEWIDNPLGSAPGLLVETEDGLLAALPGVPAEMKAMFDATLAPILASKARGALASTILRIAGRPESFVDDKVRDLYTWEGTETTILASAGSVELVLTARGHDEAAARERLSALSARCASGWASMSTAPIGRPSRASSEACSRRGVRRWRLQSRAPGAARRRADRHARLLGLVSRRPHLLRRRSQVVARLAFRRRLSKRTAPSASPWLARSRRARVASAHRISGSPSPGSRGRTAAPRTSRWEPCTSPWPTRVRGGRSGSIGRGTAS